MIAIYIDAGNPRRGWLLTADDGIFFDFVDEGYSGQSILREQYPNVPSTDRIPVPPAFYREAQRATHQSRERRLPIRHR